MTKWLGTDGFVPHGFCLSWDPNLMAMVVLSNGVIALVYLLITVVAALKAIEAAPVMPQWLY
jgi:hypothetical protein